MKGSEFLKGIRQEFDPCFRYMVLTRESAGAEEHAFSDVLALIDSDRSAVVDRSFYRDKGSGLIALVLKLQPNVRSSIMQSLVGGGFPPDIVFYIYESHDRACEKYPGSQVRTEGEIH